MQEGRWSHRTMNIVGADPARWRRVLLDGRSVGDVKHEAQNRWRWRYSMPGDYRYEGEAPDMAAALECIRIIWRAERRASALGPRTGPGTAG